MLNSCATEDISIQEKIIHSIEMDFHTNIGNLRFHNTAPIKDYFTNVVFAHSEEEFLKGNFPDDVIVAWPSLITHLRLELMNHWIRIDGERINLEELSLKYPLTMDDIIYNREKIRDIRWNNRQINNLFSYPLTQHRNIMLLELHIIVELLEKSGINIAEYDVEIPLQPIWHNIKIICKLFYALAEEVQVQINPEISTVLAEYRTILRGTAWEAKQQ